MQVGTVKWFNDAKGYGFIEPEGGGPDIFAHFSAIDMEGFRTLKQGSSVTFVMEQGPKGLLAKQIRPLGQPAAAPARPAGSSAEVAGEQGLRMTV